ncbi:MAG: hypothetical protein QXY42_07160 [Candidatus Bathyarchaeia archaeon]
MAFGIGPFRVAVATDGEKGLKDSVARELGIKRAIVEPGKRVIDALKEAELILDAPHSIPR